MGVQWQVIGGRWQLDRQLSGRKNIRKRVNRSTRDERQLRNALLSIQRRSKEHRMKHAGYFIKYNWWLPHPGKGYTCMNEWYSLHRTPWDRILVPLVLEKLRQTKGVIETPSASAWPVSRQQSWSHPTGRPRPAQDGNGEIRRFRKEFSNMNG